MINNFDINIKTKLILGLSLILILAFLAIGLLNYNASRSSLWHNIKQEALPGISNEIYHEIQKDLMAPLRVASTMAHDTFLKDWVIEGEKDVDKVTKYLWEIKEKYGFFSTFLISANTLKYYHYNGILKTISPEDEHDDWYYDFVSSGTDYRLEVDTNEAAQGTLTIFINHRLNDYEGRLIGVTGVGLNMNQMGRRLHAYEDQYDKKIYLVDKEGVIRVHSDNELVGEANIHDRIGAEEVSDDLLSENTNRVVREYDRNGDKTIVLSRYIPEFNWFLMVEHRPDEEIRSIQMRFIRNIAIGLIVTILAIVIYALLVNHYQSKLEEMANTDDLTNLFNRRHFLDRARNYVSDAASDESPLSFLMIDIDDFKDVNDTYGHDEGDSLLESTAELLDRGLREKDLLGRIGGDEFAVILPETSEGLAREVAERLRKMVEDSGDSLGPHSYRTTVSIGVATTVPEKYGNALEKLMKESDRALYRAKERGRNQVCTGKDG
jgi:diguanylate cyclase (GGDEF)-like protein